jgi:rhodanese-related sulfurtransferase
MRRNDMTNQTIDQISPSQAAARDDLLVVDVRDASEREEARAPHTLHIPLGQIEGRLAELPGDRTIAFICRSGGRSTMAANVAAGRGLDVVNVDGGMLAWEAAGLPVERGPETAKED